MLIFEDFGDGYKDPISKALSVSPPLLGIINASYSLGAICAVPFAPAFNQWVGRRWAIMCGSIVMIIGALLQGFAQQGMDAPESNSISKTNSCQSPCILLHACSWGSELSSVSFLVLL
jgi:MFS family permease